MAQDLSKLRNIGIMAHIDAGKTTVTERILYYSGRTYKMGEVHNGTAVMDYMAEEQERGITITSAATRCPWHNSEINLIDTPGHIDFTAEVERSLRVLDGAVMVLDGSEGVQAQSETVWRQGQKYELPCLCFINKMDKVGADFEMSVKSLRDKLLIDAVVVQIPIGAGDKFRGIIDLIKLKAVFYETEKLGASFRESEIPEEMRETAGRWRQKMLELIAEHDEAIMERYIHNEFIGEGEIVDAIRRATVANKITPLLTGSALKYIGVHRLLDAVVDYLPSPLERPVIVAHKHGDEKKEISIRCERDGFFVGLVFKITSDVHGDLNFVRIYQGGLKPGTRVLDTSRGRRENITRIYQMHANERKLLDYAGAGDIVALVGLKRTLTGDTICDTKHNVELPSITFPETVMRMSIEPRTSDARSKLSDALADLRREDPTFESEVDSETGQTIISGMGELHLEVLQHKLVREKGVEVRVGRPRVSYREAILVSGEGEGRFVRQTGGHGQYGHVVLRVEPIFTEDGHWERSNEFENRAGGDKVPKEYVSSVKTGCREGLSNGLLASYPVVGVRAVLIDGSFHSVDSSDLAFEQAAVLGIQDALRKAKPVLLEPIMKLEVLIPEGYFGAVQSNILSRRGLIMDSRIHGNVRVIDAKVPLAEMFGYSSDIRGISKGRGTFTMEPLSYEKVPEQISREIII